MIKVIKNVNELEEIRECWDVLYEEDDNCTPFQCFDYNYISWQRFHLGYSLFVDNYLNEQKEIVIHGKNNPCSPMFRNESGYKNIILERNRVKNLTVHYYS